MAAESLNWLRIKEIKVNHEPNFITLMTHITKNAIIKIIHCILLA